MAGYRPWRPVAVLASREGKTARNDCEISESQARCLQLLGEGKANADEQKMALTAIYWMCGVDDMEYLPDEHGGARDSAFKSGKRFVGTQLRKIVNLPLTLLTGEK